MVREFSDDQGSFGTQRKLQLTEEASHRCFLTSFLNIFPTFLFRLNKLISTWTMLLDLEGLNMRHL